MLNTRPSVQNSPPPTPNPVARHAAMVQLVQQWTHRTRGTQQVLLRAIEEFWRRRGEPDYKCDHTLLSRVLNPVVPYVPTIARPKAMRIQQALMIVCAQPDNPNIIETAGDSDSQFVSDEEQAFKVHRARLRQLRDNAGANLFQSLHRIGEFFPAARGMDDTQRDPATGETFRQRACENTLMSLAALVDGGSPVKALEARLIEEGVEPPHAAGLQRKQVDRVDSMLELFGGAAFPGVNIAAYGGAALFHCGQQERGVQLLLDSVAEAHDISLRHDPHWETVIELLERLLEADHAEAKRWSRQAMAIAAGHHKNRERHWALLVRAWPFVKAPKLREHWTELDAALVNGLEGVTVVEPVKAPVVESRSRRPAKPLGLAVMLVGALLLGTTSPAWAIRGKEGKDNVPPPPPPPTVTE
jgi:hypothetical protein